MLLILKSVQEINRAHTCDLLAKQKKKEDNQAKTIFHSIAALFWFKVSHPPYFIY